MDRTNYNLYSVNAANGAATLIGPTGLNLAGAAAAMSANTGALFAAVDSGGGSILYSVNTSTGAAAMIGNTGVTQIGAMVYQNGFLYAATEGGVLYTLDPATGKATFVANTGIDTWGMALPASTFTVLHPFTNGVDGGVPEAGLTFDRAGNLYGTASAGGNGGNNCPAGGCGTVFKLTHKGSG
jgi:outer membrane protein assembly factor BamB